MYKVFHYSCRVNATGVVLHNTGKFSSLNVLYAQMSYWNNFHNYSYFCTVSDDMANLNALNAGLSLFEVGYNGVYPHSYEFRSV